MKIKKTDHEKQASVIHRTSLMSKHPGVQYAIYILFLFKKPRNLKPLISHYHKRTSQTFDAEMQ